MPDIQMQCFYFAKKMEIDYVILSLISYYRRNRYVMI